MNKIIIYLLFLFSVNMSGQKIYLDTIQSVKGKPLFNIIVTKINNNSNTFKLQFTNYSRKNIYIVHTNIDYSYDLEDEVELGLNYNPLNDIKYYKAQKIKPNQTISINFISQSKKINFIASLILKEKFIKKMNDVYFVENPKYFSAKKAFTYILE